MKTIKSYTDIEQSKKLAEFLSLESADMYWAMETIPYLCFPLNDTATDWDCAIDYNLIPAWSLSALFRVLPVYIDSSRLRMDMSESDFNLWFDVLSSGIADEDLPDITKENPVDTCVEMILKLHEQKLL